MRYQFIDDSRAKWPVVAMCRVLGVTRQGYYAWHRRGTSERVRVQEQRQQSITKIFHESKERYGSPRIHRKLKECGLRISKNTVAKIMRNNDLRARGTRRYRSTTDSRNTTAPARNLVNRKFNVRNINRLWLSDFTELPCRQGKAYGVAIMDMCSRRVIGLVVSSTMHTSSLLQALDRAVATREALRYKRVVIHSDQGSQI